MSFDLSREINDLRKQKKKLQQMEGYMTDSKELLQEREDIIEKIDLSKILAYQLDLDKLSADAVETKKQIELSVITKGKLSKRISKDQNSE